MPRPYEFGTKVSVVATLKHSTGGEFVAHVAALPGTPCDGHRLGTAIPGWSRLIGHTIERALTNGQKRRVTPQIKRQFKRRAAVEPVIGHLEAEHRMGLNYLAHRTGDAINTTLAAAGYNFHLIRP